MSTRILTLLTTAAAALTLAGGVTAALAAPPPPPSPSGAAPSPSASPSTAPSTSPSTSPSAAPSPSAAASPGEDDAALEECRDANCEVEIRDGQKITLDGEHGATTVDVEVHGTRVTLDIRDGRSRAITTMDAGHSSADVNGVTFRPRVTKDGKLTLDISRN